MSFLDIVNELMDMGLDENTACREAYAELYSEKYDAEDYEQQFILYYTHKIISNLWV